MESEQQQSTAASDPTCKPGSQVAPELLPCPFCGESLVEHSDHHGSWWAHKDEAGPCVASCWQVFMDEPASIKRWNTRPASDLSARGAFTDAEVESLRARILRGDESNSSYTVHGTVLEKLFWADADLAAVRAENAEQKAKLDYVHSMGLRFGMMKSSDRPEPYLMHDWDEDSDHERMFREWTHSIGWETKVEKLRAENERLRRERDALFLRLGGLQSCIAEELGLTQTPKDEDDVRPILREMASRLIPVGERLPKDDRDVLALSRGGFFYISTCWSGTWSGCYGAEITHWQPLPAHPGEKGAK